MRKIKFIKQTLLSVALLMIGTSVYAQVKVGENNTVIDTANNLEVEARNGNKVYVNKTSGVLTMQSGSGVTSELSFKTNGITGAYINYNEANNGLNALMIRTRGAGGGSAGPKDIWLNTGNLGVIRFNPGDAEAMRVVPGGKVGIGTTLPTSTLDVNGTARIRTLANGATSDSLVTVDTAGVLRRRSLGSVISGTAWALNGNAGTDSTNFLGTTDSARLSIQTNNKSALTITPRGSIIVGSTNRINETVARSHENPYFVIKDGNYWLERVNPASFEAATRSAIFVDHPTNNANAATALSGSFFGGRGFNADSSNTENKAWTGTTSTIRIIQSEGDNYSTDTAGKVSMLQAFNADLGFWASNPNAAVRQAIGFNGNINAKGTNDNFLHRAFGANLTVNATGGNVAADAWGVRLLNVTAGSTGVNNAYGIQIPQVRAINGTTNNAWAIHSGTTAQSYFNGNIGIRTATPLARLDVVALDTLGVLIRSGNGQLTTNSQISFGHNQTANFRHSIRTRHNGTLESGNAIDFFVWSHLTEPDPNSNATRQVMTLNGAGNVGIGTSSPGTTLHVAGVARVDSLTIGVNRPSAQIHIKAPISDSASIQEFRMASASNSAQNRIGFRQRIGFYGREEYTAAETYSAGIEVLYGDNTHIPTFPGKSSTNMLFLTGNRSNGNATERMRIDFNGNVGIGTTAPTSKLQVAGLPAYASDAAAGAAGLTAGAFYQTSGHATLPNGVVMVKQ